MSDYFNEKNLNDFIRAYVNCALWSTVNEKVYEETGIDEHLGTQYFYEDLTEKTLQDIKEDCTSFLRERNVARVIYECCLNEGKTLADGYSYNAFELAGHDFWLTRNGHGTGFWDYGRWAQPFDKYLDAIATSYGTSDLYVGDDGLLYVL